MSIRNPIPDWLNPRGQESEGNPVVQATPIKRFEIPPPNIVNDSDVMFSGADFPTDYLPTASGKPPNYRTKNGFQYGRGP